MPTTMPDLRHILTHRYLIESSRTMEAAKFSTITLLS